MAVVTVKMPKTVDPPQRPWTGDEESIGVLRDMIQGGEILPAQLPSASHWTPEVRLAAAVLAQAIADVRWRRPDGRDRIRANAALRWVRSDDGQWPYSFLRICEVLRIEPEWVRDRVNAWLRERVAGRAVVRQAA
ncbi:hypothetical protein KF840_03885 [bacterium]|nr:hypothetical protein [bacterium]